MLERVPAAAESTAQFFIRSVDKPVRSSRILDPRFWRNGSDEHECSAWWPSYLQRVRTRSQSRQSVYDDFSATSYPSPQRRASSHILRSRHEPPLHGPVISQAQYNGTTLRSYTVSTKNPQGSAPKVVEHSIDGNDHGQSDGSDSSHAVPKETHKLRRSEAKRTVSSKQPTYSFSRSKTTTPSKQPGRRAQGMPHEMTAFDLESGAKSDLLGDDFGERQSLRPYKQTLDRKPKVDTGLGTEDKAKSGEKLFGNDAYQSFDLDSLHRDRANSYVRAFDLDAILQQERNSQGDYVAEPEQIPINSDVDSIALGDPKPYSQADIHSGWYNSNSFAALVPEEEAESEPDLPASPLTFPEESIQEEKMPLQTLQLEALPTSPRNESDQFSENVELPIQYLDRDADTIARYSKKMANSLEARASAARSVGSTTSEQASSPLSHEPEKLASQSETQDPRRARFSTLLKLRRSAAITTELLDEAWTLFLSFNDQEVLAPYMFRLLNQSPNDNHLSRALAAFNTIPRPRRTEAIYKAAMDIELKRHQHGSAMNLAFEANIKGFNILPDLVVYLVRNLLWNSVAEVLHRNRYARHEFAQFAPVPEVSATAPKRMLSMPELMSSCSSIPDLDSKVLSLAERVQSSDAAFTEHVGLLRMFLQRLAIQVVESKACMADVTPQALLSVLNIEDSLGHLALHTKALDTIFDLPSYNHKLDLAVMVYRNFRFKHPSEKPNPRIVKGLISLCSDADQPSIDLLDYLLAQFSGKPDQMAYHKVMVICARSGDAPAVERYLGNLIEHHGKPLRAAIVNPLIYAHAVKGDVLNARKQLDQMLTRFDLEPDTVSWNMLMLAHLRSDDDVSAFNVQEEMRCKNVSLNHYTYGQLLAVCATHGDIEAALDVLVDARDDGIKITVPMINTIVETYLRNDNPQAALRFAMTAVESEEKEALTRLWNSFVRYFAFKGNLTDLMKIRDLMARYDVSPDGMTYAPILTLLTLLQRTSEAMDLLRRMHAEEKLPATMFHYSIILHGYVAEGNRDMAVVVFNEMEQRFPEISASAHAAMVYLQARHDVADRFHGLHMLAKLLKDISSVKGSLFNSMSSRTQKHDIAMSTYFETIVRALIRSGLHESAAQIMKHIQVTLLARPKFETGKPLSSGGMLLAQLDIALERQDWAEFERIFHRVFQDAVSRNRSISVSRRTQVVEDDTPSKVAKAPPHAKYRLSSYFNRYMEAMARQFRQRSMVRFFRKNLSRNGFVFTGRNWNKYIQVLCRSRQSEHQLRAFRIFERTMLRRTQSWKLLARGKLKKTVTSYLWQPYGQRNRPILQRRNTHRLVKRSEELLFHPERRIPTYTTAVHLGAALLQAHFRVRRGLPLQFSLIGHHAPKTKRFIQFMPRLKDGVQGSILRQLNSQGETKRRPRSERSIREKTDLTGVLGDQSPLSHIPSEFLHDIEEVIGRGNLVRSLLKDNQTSKGRTDIELGEMITGQISRTPIVLARKGRLETVAEMKRRISGEEKQKQRTVERLREDLKARQLTGDVHRPSLQVGAPLDLSGEQEADAIHQQLVESSNPALPTLADDVVSTSGQVIPESRSGKSLGEIPVQQQLDDLAERREQSNEDHAQRSLRRPMIPSLAIPYMHLRRLRRRLGLKQRMRARRTLDAMKDELSPRAYRSRVAAADRLDKFERARRRRQAVLAYERDLKAGKRLDPFPETVGTVLRRKFYHGGVRVRFVADLGRKTKNYAVRRGKLHDRRQRRLQTIPSKEMSYITRYDRIEKWMEARYGPRRPDLDVAEELESTVEDEGEGEAGSGDVQEKVYKPFS